MLAPIATGILFAIASAVAFGLTTPVIAWAGGDVRPLITAALLYAGAALAAVAMRLRARSSGRSLARPDLPRIIVIAIVGAAIAPVCLVWGLARTGATSGSLILNLEAVLTVLLAWIIYREPLGRRLILAVMLMAGGGAVLALDVTARSSAGLLGAAAVAGATLGWAVDNTLTRALADRDPLQVIAAKGVLGATLTGALSVIRGESLPSTWSVVVLLACGATGYGVSLRLYLLAQRRIGAARTGSVFALAPFVGAASAWGLGDRNASRSMAAAAACFGIAVYLHLSERHAHEHVHESFDHAHAHRHDDGHHDHVHDPSVAGEHTHAHHHERVTHAHDHAPDIHHGHAH